MRTVMLAAVALLSTPQLLACGPSRSDDAADQDGGSGGDGGNSGGATCTPDLRGVVNADGTITACGPDQGCAGGACVAACQAAVANGGSVGCDFVVPTPAFLSIIAPPCHAVFVSNDWAAPVQLTVTRGGQTFDVTQFGRIPDGSPNAAAWPAVPATGLPVGALAVLFLSSDPNSVNGFTPMSCPITPALNQGTGIQGSDVGLAWRVTSSVPISAYDILPYGGAPSFLPSASLLLPTHTWSTQYVVTQPPIGNRGAGQGPRPWFQVVALGPTTVTVNATTPLPGGGPVPAVNPGTPGTVTLGAGEVVQWNGGGDASGTTLVADQPIAVFAGNDYLCFDSSTTNLGGCDSTHQQVFPANALGFEYVGAPYTTRRADLQEEAIVYRLTGVVDGTTLVVDPPQAGAPAALAAGQVVDLEVTGAFTVRSQDEDHPFALAQLMSGCGVIGGSRPGDNGSQGFPCLGDEEWVGLLPPAQYLGSYTFLTDPTYFTSTLTVVREADAGGTFHDVTVGCLGPLTGWQPVGSGGRHQFTTADLVRGNVGVGTCVNGVHGASSSGRFGVMVWGTDGAASYGYPAGGNLTRINDVVIE
ncbi:MAG: IgGFc-binding protein [Kofleriaceae bacterium]|jgi:hypothetical protein|nr:IgGFc-binding protein [Kofleriaceae bacterium]MBP9204812.1 IgGFc-binding protein [Kofleriaceae bacterium]